MPSTVCVVIAAMNAQATVGEAVRSALIHDEVRRVVVVDDASSDDTVAAAERADDGSGRLRIIRLPRNEGPSFARNRGIETSEEDFVAVLDADDMFLPGRFARLFAASGWDMAADNIAFVPDRGMPSFESLGASLEAANRRLAGEAPHPPLTAAAFVRGNLTRSNRERGEMGFLKPVIRRSLLGPGAAPYDEALRLGEDYELYLRLLLAGARFQVIRTCGYVARVRAESLSGRHATEDLRCLAAADRRFLSLPAVEGAARAELVRHERQTRGRFALRHFLDRKRETGLIRATAELAGHPSAWAPVAFGVGRDKLAAARARVAPSPVPTGPRFLFAPSPRV